MYAWNVKDNWGSLKSVVKHKIEELYLFEKRLINSAFVLSFIYIKIDIELVTEKL